MNKWPNGWLCWILVWYVLACFLIWVANLLTGWQIIGWLIKYCLWQHGVICVDSRRRISSNATTSTTGRHCRSDTLDIHLSVSVSLSLSLSLSLCLSLRACMWCVCMWVSEWVSMWVFVVWSWCVCVCARARVCVFPPLNYPLHDQSCL